MFLTPVRLNVEIDQQAIAAFCAKWNVIEFAVFGSVLRDDFTQDSDIDVLVTFAPNARRGLLILADMQRELSEIFGRDVDLGTRDGVEQDTNRFRHDAILRSATTIFTHHPEAKYYSVGSLDSTAPILGN